MCVCLERASGTAVSKLNQTLIRTIEARVQWEITSLQQSLGKRISPKVKPNRSKIECTRTRHRHRPIDGDVNSRNTGNWISDGELSASLAIIAIKVILEWPVLHSLSAIMSWQIKLNCCHIAQNKRQQWDGRSGSQRPNIIQRQLNSRNNKSVKPRFIRRRVLRCQYNSVCPGKWYYSCQSRLWSRCHFINTTATRAPSLADKRPVSTCNKTRSTLNWLRADFAEPQRQDNAVNWKAKQKQDPNESGLHGIRHCECVLKICCRTGLVIQCGWSWVGGAGQSRGPSRKCTCAQWRTTVWLSSGTITPPLVPCWRWSMQRIVCLSH